MAIRVSGRCVLRSLAVVLLAACPLVAADPPRVTLGPPVPHTDVLPASYTGPSAGVGIPPVPLARYPERYTGLDWGRLSDQLATVKRRNAERVPFDLKYLPPAGARQWKPEVVAAVRPCAIFDRPHGDRLISEWLVKTGVLNFAKAFLGLGGINWPALQDIDMIAVRGHLDAKVTENGTQFVLGVNDAHGAVIRTRERYPWRDELARVAPALGTANYRGVEYRTTKVDIKQFFPQWPGAESALVGLYVADDHTLVIDSEEAIARLIDRLLDATPAEVPAGWEKVSRGICALAMSCPSKGWTSELPGTRGPRLPKGGDWEWNTLDDLHELLIGFDDRPTTRLYLSANAFDPFAGKRMTWNAKRLLALVAAALVDAPGPEGEQARAVWQKATFTPTFRGFQISVDAGSDLLNPLLDEAAEEKSSPPSEPEPRPFARGLRPSSGFSATSNELVPLRPRSRNIGPPITLEEAEFIGRLQSGTAYPCSLPSAQERPCVILPSAREYQLAPSPSTQPTPFPPLPGSENKGASDLPPIPQAPRAHGYYYHPPISGLGGPWNRSPGF